MDRINNLQKYRGNKSVDFADEIRIGKNPIITKNFSNYSDIEFFTKPSQKETPNKFSHNYFLSFSMVSFVLIVLIIISTKIISTSFTSFSTSLFVVGYFILFISTIYLISKRKMLSLEVKDKTLHIKSFPALNKRIPVNQILKCELNTMDKEKFTLSDRVHFALNENGNRYKLPLTSGIALQLIDGNHIIISSSKS